MKKPYRSVEYNDERKWKKKSPLDDITQVGLLKAIGYIGIDPDLNLNLLKKTLSKKNKLVYHRPKDNDYWSDTLWVGDETMIQSIINSNKKLLVKSNWPLDAKKLFNKICTTDIIHNKNKALYHLICKLFNSWCLHCERAIWIPGRKDPLSAHPYDPDKNG